MIEIKDRWNGAVIRKSETATTIREAVIEAVKAGANLYGANLSRADLSGADLYGANLYSRERTIPLLLLLDQPGKIRLYKLVNANCEGPWSRCNGFAPITYEIGKTYAVKADCDVNRVCCAGLHVATLDWCLKEWRAGYRVLIVEFTAKDIACIPNNTDGKIRLHKCKVVGEKDLTGLVPVA